MDFSFTESQRLIQQSARDFCRHRLVPRAAAFERAKEIPLSIVSELAELGFMGVAIHPRYGGSDAGTIAFSLALREVAAGCASTAVMMAVTNMVAEVIQCFGTNEQKEEHVAAICSGRHPTAAFALSEAHAGSDPGAMRTVAKKTDQGWRISGSKQWITNGCTAGVFVLWARTSDAGNKGLSCFLIPRNTRGLHVGKREDKMGLRASDTVPLVLEDCRLPSDALLGEEGQGFKIAMHALNGGRISIASQCLGIARSAFEKMCAYAQQRKQFGSELSSFQGIQWMIADSQKDLDAMRMLTDRAAALKEQGVNFMNEASMAKLVASEAAWRICNRAVQVHGGYGYTREYDVERHLRDVRATQIYEGSSEIQRLVIARMLLR